MQTSLVWYHVRRALAPVGHLAAFALWRSLRVLRFVLTLAFFALVAGLGVAGVALVLAAFLPGAIGVALVLCTYCFFQYVSRFWSL